MAFSNGQLVQASDLNNLSVTSVTTTGAVSVGTTLAVTGATTMAAVTASSLLDISGASAGQIKFPATQNASTNANTLDDYEEGTWTPSIGGSGGKSGQAYSVQVGSYVKIGKLVWASFFVNLSTLGTVTGNVQIEGLPFTSQNTANLSASATIGLWSNLSSNFVYLSGLLSENATVIPILGATAAATALSSLVQADLGNTSRIVGSIVYRADA